MKPQKPGRAPLDSADRLLLEEIRGMATALFDGPARWNALYVRVTDAKARKLQWKLGMSWRQFLAHIGVPEDDWTRIRLAVVICRALREAGVPLPKNHGQVEQLRPLRDDREQLVNFCRQLISDFGHFPAARIIRERLNGGAVPDQPVKTASPKRGSAEGSVVLPATLADDALAFLTCLSRGEHFPANTIGKRLAEGVLTSMGRTVPGCLPFPVHEAPVKPAEFDLGDPRIPIPRKPRRSPVNKPVGLGGQMLLAIDGDAPPEIREICGISENSPTLHGAPQTTSGTGASSGTPEFRENGGNSEVTPLPLQSTPTVPPLSSKEQGSANTDTAKGDELGQEVVISWRAKFSEADVDYLIDIYTAAFEWVPIANPAETTTPSCPPAGDACGDASTVNRDELLSTEFTRAGASVKSAVQVQGGRVGITLLVTPGESSWRDYCPTPPFFARVPQDSSTARFDLVSELPFGPRAVVGFAIRYLMSRGNLDLLARFGDEEFVAEAKLWLAQHGSAA